MLNWIKNLFKKPAPMITMIAAIQNDRGIGYKNNLIHSIKNDMKHFVEQTTGHTVIMGRKNWESIPEKHRPFKNRENIIITRNPEIYTFPNDVIVVDSIEKAIASSTSNKIYIIGGGQIYNLGMKYADQLDLTIIEANTPADVFFPEFKHNFECIKRSETIHDQATDTPYTFTLWQKK